MPKSLILLKQKEVSLKILLVVNHIVLDGLKQLIVSQYSENVVKVCFKIVYLYDDLPLFTVNVLDVAKTFGNYF